MKYIYLLLITSLSCFAQTVEVKYFENTHPVNQKLETLPENIKVAYKKNIFSYILTTNGRKSFYKNEKFDIVIKEESATSSSINDVGDTIKKTIISEGFDLRYKEKMYFKDFKQNKSYNERFTDEKICIIDSIVVQDWIISDETEKILGYQCKKAIYKRNDVEFTAWFTEEIPISDGPFLYSGLPGLILKISSKYLDIVAYDVKIKNETIDIKLPFISSRTFNNKTYKEYVENKNKERSRF
ncbi:MAG: GLPGLI family protein [Flavobacterium sp.]